jgi:hypothetical protein
MKRRVLVKARKIVALLLLGMALVSEKNLSVMAQDLTIASEVIDSESLTSEITLPVQESENYEDVLGYALQNYNATFCEKEVEVIEAMEIEESQRDLEEYEITSLMASVEEVVLQTNGRFTFVDIIGKLQSGNYVNLSTRVTYKVVDPEIVTCSRGRVYGVNVGTTEVLATYGNYEVSFKVTVQEFLDFNAMIQALIEGNGIETFSLEPSQIIDTMNRANSVVHVRWHPVQQFRLNDGTYAYPTYKNTTIWLEGMPYSQRAGSRCTVSEFLNHVSEEEFYEEYEHKRWNDTSTYWAKYGIDCSGLLAIAWNIPLMNENTKSFWEGINGTNSGKFEKVGTYSTSKSTYTNEVNQTELKNAYTFLKPGDAVVTRYESINANGIGVPAGHARLVTGVNVDKREVHMLEARNNFPELICVSFDDLAAEYYCPFAIKSSYYNSKR